MSSEVPFKDFLVYLYHSATPSPSSTREGSMSRGNFNSKARQITSHQEELDRSLERIKSKSQGDLSRLDHHHGGESRGRNHMGIMIHHEMSSKSKPGNKVDNLSTNTTKSNKDIHNKTLSTISSKMSSNNKTGQAISSQPSLNTKQRKASITTQKASSTLLDAPSPPPSLIRINLDHEVVKASKAVVRKGMESGDQSRNVSRASYRESLGDHPPFQLKTKKDTSSNSHEKKNKNKVIPHSQSINSLLITKIGPVIKLERKESSGEEIHQLCMNGDHGDDLSFFKNFSATTRSKSSLAAYFLTQSENRCNCVQHIYDAKDQEICCNYTRLCRSTPIALDAISNVADPQPHRHALFPPNTTEHSNLLRSSHLDYNQHEDQPPSQESDEEWSSQNARSPPVVMEKEDGNESQQAFSLSEKGNNLDTRKLCNSLRSQLVHNSKSSPALDNNGFDEEIQETPSRRINNASSNALLPVVSRNKRMSNDTSSGSTTTTVTVKMDNTSLFLDTVYVNLKQDIDTAASIKLFY